jgi:hypothetical protein
MVVELKGELLMNIYLNNFSPAKNIHWDGKVLSNLQGVKASCIRNIGKYKLFVFKQWGGNGFGNNSDYYIVNLETVSISAFHSVDNRNAASRLSEYLKTETDL